MNKLGCLIGMFFTCGVCNAQNLVPNFGFEQQDTCEDVPDEIERCRGWLKFSELASTPDYYNACALYHTVPNSFNGYQQDHRNCSAYMGLVTWSASTNDREHIGIQLSQPLIVGQKYFLSFYTVMAEVIYPNGYHYAMPSNGIGLRLSTVAYSTSNPCPIDNFTHLYSTAIINDSINWLRISGSIIADSAYTYFIIGNFLDDAHTDTLHYTCDSCLNEASYYYVDDVCLSIDSLLCNGGIDNIPCNVGITENVSVNGVNIFPNPISDKINITGKINELIEFVLYDFTGRKTLQQFFTNSTSVNTEQLAKGIYLYEVRNKNGVVKKGKIVKD
jgi:hypothetical protein